MNIYFKTNWQLFPKYTDLMNIIILSWFYLSPIFEKNAAVVMSEE